MEIILDSVVIGVILLKYLMRLFLSHKISFGFQVLWIFIELVLI